MRVLGADDDASVGPRPPRGGERDERGGRRGVLDVPVPAFGEPEQARQPRERDLLELLERRRRPPEDADVVERGDQQLGEDPRLRRTHREVGEEARALPVRDPRHEDLVEIAEHGRERLGPLGRRGG
jgi:hypothetical protein